MKWSILDDVPIFTDAKAICDLVNIITRSDDYEGEYFEVDERKGHIISDDRILMVAPKTDFDVNGLQHEPAKSWSYSMGMLKKISGLCNDYDDQVIFPNIAVPMKIQCNNFDIYIAPRIEEVDDKE